MVASQVNLQELASSIEQQKYRDDTVVAFLLTSVYKMVFMRKWILSCSSSIRPSSQRGFQRMVDATEFWGHLELGTSLPHTSRVPLARKKGEVRWETSSASGTRLACVGW